MLDTSRQDLGELLGFSALLVTGGAIAYLLAPIARRGRTARALVGFWAGALGGWVWSVIGVAVGGTHQEYRDRATGAWHDVHLQPGGDVEFALWFGIIIAACVLWLPVRVHAVPGAAANPRTGGRRRRRRASGRRAG